MTTKLEQAARQAFSFCEEISSFLGKYPYVNGTEIVADARQVSASLREALDHIRDATKMIAEPTVKDSLTVAEPVNTRSGSEYSEVDHIADADKMVAEPMKQEPVAWIDIGEMVNRFLGWKLPSDFSPDCGITFKREPDYEHPVYGKSKYEPVGTNLFTADQAKAMFEYCLQDLAVLEPTKQETEARRYIIGYQPIKKYAVVSPPPKNPSGKSEQTPIATKQLPDPYDDRDGVWFDAEGLKRLRALPPGTQLYTTPPSSQLADAAVEAAIEATKEKAAKVCEEIMEYGEYPDCEADQCAAAIRGLK